MIFLTARWTHLFLATYEVPERLLLPRLPAGLELDRRDGACFVSLVAFDFHDTRVLGVPWPGFRNFPELNLRTYVRHGLQRGVLFIREYIQSRFVAWMARTLYNEPYRTTRMRSQVRDEADAVHVEHRLDLGGRSHALAVTGTKPAYTPGSDSVEHFFKEQEWGFGSTRSGTLMRYRVDHPTWEVHPVRDWAIDIDWSMLYGPEWGEMQNARPVSTMLAAGSPVRVHYGQRVA